MFAILVLAGAQAAPTWSDAVRPLLAERCLACHGPDDEHRAANLRLDTPQGLARALTPGAPDESELIYRVEAEADFDRMPPAGHGPALTADEVALLRRWIEAGAEWAPHWAYAPPREPALPEVAGSAWVRGPIDRFVLARLEAEGLAPSPEASPRALLRRVHLDLTGLPPTEDELAAFLADSRPDAYERRVDELLASVHFAERFARHWLDLARYADSNGYTIDGGRSIWPWRDWVVDSIHRDQPFDEFTIEQLAGDLLPGATRAQRLATGFQRNTQTNEEGGADDEENRVNAVLDRVSTMGAVWLGATLGCAQCHTHKFDPITHREFYQLYAFFDQTRDGGVSTEPSMLVARTPAEERAATEYEAEAARLDGALAAARDESAPGWVTWQPPRAWASNGAKLRPEEDGAWTALGQNAVYSTYVLEGPLPATADGVAALRLEALPRAGLGGGGPGRSGSGNFVLQEVRVFTRADAASAWAPVALAGARADFEQDTRAEGGAAYSAASVVAPKGAASGAASGAGWAVKPEFGTPHVLELRLASPLAPSAQVTARTQANGGTAATAGAAAELRVELVQEFGGRHTLGAFRLALAAAPSPLERALVTDAWRAAWRDVQGHGRARPSLPSSLVLEERTAPRVTRRFNRGSFLDPLEVVQPGFPLALDHFSGAAGETADRQAAGTAPLNRLDLARWLVDPRNALVQRVEVNRTWQHLFGRGLVATENDFGLRGARPTHPALLDWLAQDFVAHGFSRKHLVRTIVTSATYRQAVTFDPALLERDPSNELLARQRLLRLEGEVLRDSMLVASGLLDATVGGPPVQPPQPDGVFAFTQSAKKWEPSAGSARFRRSLYTRIWRTAPFPFYATFDAPAANATCTRRERSTSPLQALALANDPMALEPRGGPRRAHAGAVVARRPRQDRARL
ncbi:MAG: PSD1 and planctomycete cytochrome C domain-containing protein [Planctomycetota bacterium]